MKPKYGYERKHVYGCGYHFLNRTSLPIHPLSYTSVAGPTVCELCTPLCRLLFISLRFAILNSFTIPLSAMSRSHCAAFATVPDESLDPLPSNRRLDPMVGMNNAFMHIHALSTVLLSASILLDHPDLHLGRLCRSSEVQPVLDLQLKQVARAKH